MEEICFRSSDGDDHDHDQEDDDDEEGSFVLAKMEEGIDIELALMNERHEGIREIHDDMKRINEIQKGAFDASFIDILAF